MAKTDIGSVLSNGTPVDLPGYPEKESDENGNWIHREMYWQKTSSVSTDLPEFQDTTNHKGETVISPNELQLYCARRNIRAGDAPGVSTVELTYKELETSPIEPSDNPRTVRMRGQDIPIDDERLLSSNGGVFTSAQIETAKNAGYKSLPLYSIEYTYTEVDASFGWSESDIVGALQTTGVPTGISGGTPDDWQLIGKEIDENRNETVIRTHWEYSGPGFVPL